MAKLTSQPQHNPLSKNRIRSNKASGKAAAIPAVRILPMDPKEKSFKGCSVEDVQEDFFLDELRGPNRVPGRYFYHRFGLRAPEGSVVLFQFTGMIIASAIFMDSKREPNGDYQGWLLFDPDSIEVFDPIGAPAIKKVWPIVTRLGRAKWDLPPERYPKFLKLLKPVRKASSR